MLQLYKAIKHVPHKNLLSETISLIEIYYSLFWHIFQILNLTFGIVYFSLYLTVLLEKQRKLVITTITLEQKKEKNTYNVFTKTKSIKT